MRTANAPNPDDYVILPDLISKEPLGPMLRRGDDELYAIARWILFATLEAEEKGVTSENAADMLANSSDPTVQRLLGGSGEMGSLLGLRNDWALDIITELGNYGEMYERNITPLGLPRGLNALWTEGASSTLRRFAKTATKDGPWCTRIVARFRFKPAGNRGCDALP